MTIKLFFCYAREDEYFLNELKKQLSPMRKLGAIDTWHDRDIRAGTVWETALLTHLQEAHIILLLVSPDFMDSDYCFGIEMQKALEKHQRGEATVIPIILRHIYWQATPLGRLQVLPIDGIPVHSAQWFSLDEALFHVAQGVYKAAGELVRSKETQAAQRAKVLIADDSISIRRLLSQILQQDKLLITEASDGLDALGKLLNNIPDIFVLDIEMPNLNGYDLLKIIRFYPELSRVKIIILTSRTSPQHMQWAIELGAHAYLTKPTPHDVLLSTVQKMLASKHIDTPIG